MPSGVDNWRYEFSAMLVNVELDVTVLMIDVELSIDIRQRKNFGDLDYSFI